MALDREHRRLGAQRQACAKKQTVQREGKPYHPRRAGEAGEKGLPEAVLGRKERPLGAHEAGPQPCLVRSAQRSPPAASGINSKALPSSRFVWILWSPWADFDESTFKNIVRRALETLVARQVLNYKGSAMAGGWRQARQRGSGARAERAEARAPTRQAERSNVQGACAREVERQLYISCSPPPRGAKHVNTATGSFSLYGTRPTPSTSRSRVLLFESHRHTVRLFTVRSFALQTSLWKLSAGLTRVSWKPAG